MDLSFICIIGHQVDFADSSRIGAIHKLVIFIKVEFVRFFGKTSCSLSSRRNRDVVIEFSIVKSGKTGYVTVIHCDGVFRKEVKNRQTAGFQ